MPSSLPGYEYDVFISYRQKDNKYDGWVTEFIANFRKELEATFKEEIFIYSDENAFDGLHEMHQVKESLSGKLKCLIFMPIISHTYCDPASYAWNNEFLVYKKLTEKKNGKDNEASRLADEIKNQWGEDDNYLMAQLQLFDGEFRNALQLLTSEEIGWYTLNLCTINLLFESVNADPQFKRFLEWNREAISDKRDRIRQLENQGYLQRPMQYVKGTVPRKLSRP